MENTQDSNKPAGPMAGIVIIVIVLAFGGYYLWSQKISKTITPDEATAEEILGTPDKALEALKEENTSDEVSAIEEDLDATNLEDLDQELQNIESELQGF